jgi:hypothetical protein
MITGRGTITQSRKISSPRRGDVCALVYGAMFTCVRSKMDTSFNTFCGKMQKPL